MYFLARIEIMTCEDKDSDIVTERAKLIGFDKVGKPFMKIDLEDLDCEKHVIVTSFNKHGDTYLIIRDRN